MDSPSSKQLIARCIAGDAEAHTLIVERYQGQLLGMAGVAASRSPGKIEPESIVAEVFARFLQLAQSGRLEWQFEGGLWRLLSRMTSLRLKEKQRELHDPRQTARGGSQGIDNADYVSESHYDLALATALEEFRELLGEYRSQLADDRRRVFDRWVAGQSTVAIGEAVDMTDRHVRRILKGFRDDLSCAMNERLE